MTGLDPLISSGLVLKITQTKCNALITTQIDKRESDKSVKQRIVRKNLNDGFNTGINPVRRQRRWRNTRYWISFLLQIIMTKNVVIILAGHHPLRINQWMPAVAVTTATKQEYLPRIPWSSPSHVLCCVEKAQRKRVVLVQSWFTPTLAKSRAQPQSRILRSREKRWTRLYVSTRDPGVAAGFLKASLTSYYRNHLSFRHQTIGTINHQIRRILIKAVEKSQLIFWPGLINNAIVWSNINIWKVFWPVR